MTAMGVSSNHILHGWAVPPRPAQPRQPGAGAAFLELRGEITVEASIALFAAIEAARGDSIELTIASPGGSAVCAVALFEVLIGHPCRVVARMAHAESGAALVAMGADLRRIDRSGRVMLHRTQHGSLEKANAETLRSCADNLDMIDRLAVEIFAAATSRPAAEIEAWERASTTFSAREALAAGLAHEVVSLNRVEIS